MKVAILGSTGSIGTQALEVADDLKEEKELEITALTGNSNVRLLEEQARKYKPRIAAAADEKCAAALRVLLADTDVKVLSGEDGLCEAAAGSGADILLSAIVGFAGLVPTMCAVKEGIDIALANKETLVTAGGLFMNAVEESGSRLIPVDSEHSAIFQSLQSGKTSEISRILLTASGGPFYGKSAEALKDIRREQALKHPNWSMGAKITIDSATLMNKGLEVIEAKWLFGVDIDNIDVLVHRESIIHSGVEFCDGSVIAQMSLPSMKHPIQYAFTYPNRKPSPDARLNLKQIGRLTFAQPDEETFKCLTLAKQAGRQGGIMPTVLNAANEFAVAAFLKDKIGFLQIADIVESVLVKYKNEQNPSLERIIEVNEEVRHDLDNNCGAYNFFYNNIRP